MAKLPALILLLLVYGGLGLLGFALLAVGARTARRRASVIAIALAGGAMILLQTVLLYFLSDISRGWGGDSFGGIPVLFGIAGVAAVSWFLRAKLPGAAPPAPGDPQSGAQ